MSDDRNWDQYNRPKYISFREYVKSIVDTQPQRSEELTDLLKVFDMEVLERVLDGGRIIQAQDFLKGGMHV